MEEKIDKLCNELEKTIIALSYAVELLETSIKVFTRELNKYKELEKYKEN